MATTQIITVMEAQRRKLRINQLDLAIKVGVSQAVISQYERGYLIGIRTETIKKIAKELKVEDHRDLLTDFVEYEIRRKLKASVFAGYEIRRKDEDLMDTDPTC